LKNNFDSLNLSIFTIKNILKKINFNSRFIVIIIGLIFVNFVFPQTSIKSDYNYRNYTTESGLPSSETYDIEQDEEGNIWIATDRGVVKYNGNKFRNYTTKDGLIDNVILNIYKDSFKRIWVFNRKK
jgi:ligand-binding sensor domain-containing protein